MGKLLTKGEFSMNVFEPDLSECVSAEAGASPRVTARPPPT